MILPAVAVSIILLLTALNPKQIVQWASFSKLKATLLVLLGLTPLLLISYIGIRAGTTTGFSPSDLRVVNQAAAALFANSATRRVARKSGLFVGQKNSTLAFGSIAWLRDFLQEYVMNDIETWAFSLTDEQLLRAAARVDYRSKVSQAHQALRARRRAELASNLANGGPVADQARDALTEQIMTQYPKLLLGKPRL